MKTLLIAAVFFASSGLAIAASAPINPPKIPKTIINNLVLEYCGFPTPNPKATTVKATSALAFSCFDEKPSSKSATPDYQIAIHPLIAQDFNNDGNLDLAVELESAGALGGNVHSNSTIYYFILDKNQRVKTSFEVLLYAPFSEEYIEYDLSKQGIEYRAIPNFRVYPEAFEDGELIAPETHFRMQWKNGRLERVDR